MTGAKPIPLNDADVVGIDGLIDRWRQAWLSRDWDAVAAMCTDDIAILSPGEPTVSGAALRSWLESYPEIKSLEWINTHSEGTTQLAVVRGKGKLEIVQDGETVRSTGRFCDILRKDDVGAWLVACINWVPDTP